VSRPASLVDPTQPFTEFSPSHSVDLHLSSVCTSVCQLPSHQQPLAFLLYTRRPPETTFPATTDAILILKHLDLLCFLCFRPPASISHLRRSPSETPTHSPDLCNLRRPLKQPSLVLLPSDLHHPVNSDTHHDICLLR
jgi:hypothetical protein